MNIINIEKNLHYQNQHGKQLKDFIIANDPEFWKTISTWSAIKYYIRAGKKDGESLEKDLGKCKDYVKEYVVLDGSVSINEVMEDLELVKTQFEAWKGE
ncbi:hypothetical protein 56301_30 [Lactococcus phage 56301]|uniref:DUF3310 domain-containing protein n=1 Tax=Lactococcus phage 56301 TaxID=2029666 RepID=A0A343JPN8_9CAUD|nr:hypothetical protein HYP32_gp30 [Lactococcus phage 56301]ASZ71461.1 hypothetical protein 56301_30 [Lactococcus phage 56301]